MKVNNVNTRTICKICSKLTTTTPQQCHWRRSGESIVNFEKISQTEMCSFDNSKCLHWWLWTSNYQLIPHYHLLIQSQHKKHYTKVWNMFKVNNNKNTRKKSMISSGVFIINFEPISHLLVFLLSALNM